MRTWVLDTSPADAGRVSAAIGDMVSAIGSTSFEQALLSALNDVLPIGCWSVYKIRNNHPKMYLSGTYQRRDTTRGSWQAYLSGPHSMDTSFQLIGAPVSEPTVCHVTAEEIPSKMHRDRVYRQFRMIERLSIAEQLVTEAVSQKSVFAINLYRYEDQQHFSDRELVAFELLAKPMLAVVRRHLALQTPATPASAHRKSIDDLRRNLKCGHPELSDRELDVCARVMTGMTYEGIAADLGLKLPTVKTYRNRAFGRLGIHFRSELVRYYLQTSTLSDGA